jgi:hypothetical protein
MTNIMGEGTVNTEGLWRREQREWNDGAGQQYLDHRQEDSAARFYSSKGVDVFNYPYQATLLPDTYKVVNSTSNIQAVACNGYIVTAQNVTGNPASVVYYQGNTAIGTAWPSGTTMAWGTTYGGTAPSNIYDIAASATYVFLATSSGLWFGQPGVGSLQLFASGTYTMVSWANDQLIAANGANLFAFQPRSATTAPVYGSGPSSSVSAQQITQISNVGTGFKLVLSQATPNFVVGQSVTISGTQTYVIVGSGSLSLSGTTATATSFGSQPHGLQVGNTINLALAFSAGNISETAVVTAVSGYTFSWTTTKVTTTTGFTGATVTANTSLYNNTWNLTAISGQTLTLQLAGGTTPSNSTYGAYAIGGSIGSNTTSDLLFTHEDPNWVWSDAVGGETQVYFAGYSSHNTSGTTTNGNGCVYRSDLIGSSTTSTTGVTTISSSNAAQPFQLASPVQALPMSPDEYPTAIRSYLNFIFIGTNRGIRMAQTLSVYDPTATATGDLKSGPLIPNILQPLNNPVTAIIGDGRFVWFTWNNYDSSSTGLGKLDLTTFINGDPLAPVYASDLMVTGQGTINSLVWNPSTNLPLIAVNGLGLYQPYATNTNGRITATKYVATGNITTSIFDYGIPDQKAPVYFEYGGVTPDSSTLQANVICEPLEPTVSLTLPVASFTSPTVIGTAIKEYPMPTVSGISNPKSSQFQVVVNLNAGTSGLTTPTLYRWTLKSFPNVVSGSNISVVLQLFSVDVVDGVEVYMDPYDNFYWLESLRQAQNLVTYQEGPLSASIAIIESLDWIPHKRRDNYENGYEGDCVVTLKTLGPYSYNKPNTN